MTTTIGTNYLTCHQCQDRLHQSLPILQNDNNSMLLLRSELGQLREQLNKKSKLLEQQQLDMEQLNSKYVAALDQVAMIQHEKDLAERELEDLTSRLFEQANMMVANEKREVYRLRTELDRAQSLMELEQTKYKQLLQQNNDIKTPSIYSSGYATVACDDILPMDLGYDQQHVQLFQQFIQAINTKPTLSQHKQHPFMKQCLIGDVEPCINFGTGNRLPSIKKMVDALMQQPCVLEEVHSTSFVDMEPTASSSIGQRWNRFVSGVSLVDCAGCGNTLNMQHYYRFRLIDSGAGENDWLHLDATCRDRLKSVCSFFGFMRQLSNLITSQHTEMDKDHDQLRHNQFDELLKQSSDGPCPLYMEMTRLRLAMFYARLGIKLSSWSADDDATSTTSTQAPMTPVSSLSRQISNKPSHPLP